jgi:hypothetical protein
LRSSGRQPGRKRAGIARLSQQAKQSLQHDASAAVCYKSAPLRRDGMEPLALLAILVAIVCVGYIVVNIVFKIIGTAIEFVETNKFAIVVILALMLAFWLGHNSF